MGKWVSIIAAGAVASVLPGCGHGPRSVSDPDPADKIPAIKQASRIHDRKAIPQLVADLDNDDPAIRLYAIDGLRRLTGQDFGYHYFADDRGRKPALELWHQWLAKQSKVNGH